MQIGTGATITFDSGFFAEVLDIRPCSAAREAVNVSHMGTTDAHEFKPVDLVDWGEVTVELGLFPGTAPPIDDSPETITITFPDSASTTWVWANSFMTAFEAQVPLEDKMTATCRIKLNGKPTIS